MAKNELVLNRGLKFGIELEVVAPNGFGLRDVRALLKTVVRCNINDRQYTHEVVERWKVVTDASLSGNAYEIVSPPLTSLNEVELVCKVLNENGFTVNTSCGFHVHHEIKDLDYKALNNLFRLYDKYEAHVINKMLPGSRRNSRWCKPVSNLMPKVEQSTNLEEFLRNVGHCHISRSNIRYHSLNLNSFLKYGTIEFRHHSGTIDFEKIKMWVLLTHKMIETAIEKKAIRPVSESRLAKWESEVRHSSYDFYKELGINGTELSEYIGSRRKVFKEAQ